MKETTIEQKRRLIEAGRTAVNELIKVAESIVINDNAPKDIEHTELAADKMKNAAAAKKLAIFDAFEILDRLSDEEEDIKESLKNDGKDTDTGGFAELHAG